MSKLNWMFCGALCFWLSAAQGQTCRTEAEIPSSTPTADFVDHGDGTVTHKKTGLMWMKCPLGQSGPDCATGSADTYTWEQALETADGHSFAGYSDWRLPNVKELRSIVEQRCYGPAINLSVFPATPGSYFWSSSPNASNSGYAWHVYFDYGYDDYSYSRGHALLVRLVRSGQ
jgi:hypothetical protein